MTNELDSTCGISDDELTHRFVEGIKIENERKRLLNVPLPCYDSESKRAYLQYADGRKEYVSAN